MYNDVRYGMCTRTYFLYVYYVEARASGVVKELVHDSFFDCTCTRASTTAFGSRPVSRNGSSPHARSSPIR